jgi:lipopolysaccharide export system permease protein
MEDLFIQDNRDPEVAGIIVASRGRIATDPQKRALIFQLFNGVIDRFHQERDSTETITFDKYELKLQIGELGGDGTPMQRDQYEMNLDELWRVVDQLKTNNDPKYPTYLMEAHRRLALPVACIILGLIAVPLGVQYRARGRNWGLVMGMVVFLCYYLFMTLAHGFGDSGYYPPVLAVWAPNMIIGLVAVYMIIKANNEKPFFNVDRITRIFRINRHQHQGGPA